MPHSSFCEPMGISSLVISVPISEQFCQFSEGIGGDGKLR
ncbi:hypothetical protein CWATWH0402_4035 [Crocosphaera watsonii WH 0402]|uniref:Uncharacterized protein n=1 Tax=Crocosphaera watsonii WH 0402 TaxID=1284629 RepID=T2JL05_CROWT|nr:hypothetical protein CWATWH0402_4035 [Crocosphaera watsonii WH 0402]